MQVLTGGCQPLVWERVVVWVGDKSPPLSSPGTTSYRLPIVTIGLSLTVFAVLWVFQTDNGYAELV